jgi:hypothetical protein
MFDINHFGNLGAESNAPVQGPSQQTGPDKKPSPLSASSIQQSELEAIALLMVAGIPILQSPDLSGNVSSSHIAGIAALSAAARENEIITTMWDRYIDNIREISERLKKEDIKDEIEDISRTGPKSSVEYFAFLMASTATRRAEEIDGSGPSSLAVQFTNAYNDWLVNPIQSGATLDASGSYPSAAFMAGCVACSPDAIRSAIGADSAVLGIQLSASPVADALAAAGPTSGLPGDYQAAAALVAALLYGGAVNRATAETIAQGKGAQAQYDLNFATNFAKEIMAIVTKDIGKGDPTNPYRETQNTMMRLMLSAIALNMVYRSAYGGMHSKEFAALLSGEATNVDPAIKGLVSQLADLVNHYLPTDSKARAETIARLMEYVDSKDPVDSMLQTSRLFSSFLNTSSVDANRLASRGG